MSEASQIKERRQHKRFDVIAQVELNWSDDVLFLELDNLSVGGALMSVTARDAPSFSTGDEVSAFLDLGSDEAGENLAVSLEGEVVRLVAAGPRGAPAVAIRWKAHNALATAGLSRIVAHVGRQAPGA